MSIEVKGVSKRFGSFTAVDNVNLEVPNGSLVALLGPSGSGKTTLLRIIAGLEQADAGSIHFHQEDATAQPVRHRNVGFVFQHYALFKHMTIFDNIAFGLKVRKRPKDEIEGRVRELLRLIQLENVEKRYPAQLSGGQRQRVALARALATRPQILLLDEPFGALDAKVRKELRQWIRQLHEEIKVTSLFVTHDQEEALELADQVVLMNKGRVEQVGTPEQVYNQPATPFVVNFLGDVNIFRARVEGEKVHLAAGMEAQAPVELSGVHQEVMAFVRPHEIDVDLARKDQNSARARVKRVLPIGSVVTVELVLADDGTEVQVELTRERYAALSLNPGEEVFLTPRGVKVVVGHYEI
ncbi:MAG: sulfate ABC transporter ATP-binding protein [Candidatus Latescibacteria bacterium]|nr:sulfate ABC transporter ATP-binding protein [Candidatus Latescibacterota bacterium]